MWYEHGVDSLHQVHVGSDAYLNWNVSWSPTFNDRYREQDHPKITFCGETSFYKKQKVQQIMVKDSRGDVIWDMEFSDDGAIVSQGVRGREYYIRTYPLNSNTNLPKKAVHYYQGELLVRLDTIIKGVVQFENEDTLMYYDYYSIKTYKLGALINEQNRYYNENYDGISNYPWTLSMPSICFIDTVVITASEPNYEFDIVYFFSEPDTSSTLLKTDYDSLNLYLCKDECRTSNFTCYLKKFRFEMDETQIPDHPMSREYSRPWKYEILVDGEDFYELTTRSEFYPCSISINQFDYGPSIEYKFTYNDLGLIDEIQEWSYALLDEYEETNEASTSDDNSLYVGLNCLTVPLRKRSQTPVISVLYRYEYLYFD